MPPRMTPAMRQRTQRPSLRLTLNADEAESLERLLDQHGGGMAIGPKLDVDDMRRLSQVAFRLADLKR